MRAMSMKIPNAKHFAFLISFLIVSSVPVLASETWSCNFASISGPAKGIKVSGRILIDQDTLDWQVLFPKRPVPPYDGAEWTSFKKKLLENNAVGAVAETSQAHANGKLGPLIGASIMTLNKSTGDLRMGSVMSTGVYDLLIGHCDHRIP